MNVASVAVPTVTHALISTAGLADKVSIRNLDFYYGDSKALKDINISLYQGKVTAFIGPSGCGKSTLLRVLNRMYDLYPNQRAEGRCCSTARTFSHPSRTSTCCVPVSAWCSRRTPFPMSIYENIAFGIRLYEKMPKSELDGRVETRCGGGAVGRGQGQAQRQRTQPLGRPAAAPVHRAHRGGAARGDLFDEPCSALDPISTAKIEELIDELKEDYTIVIVTHNMQQAARVSDFTAFMYLGELIEFDTTSKMFTAPGDRRTQDYITGRFG